MTETTTPTSTYGREYDAQFADFTADQLTDALGAALATYNARCKHWDACDAAYEAAFAAQNAAAQTTSPATYAARRAEALEARAAMNHARALVTEQGKIIASINRTINARHADV